MRGEVRDGRREGGMVAAAHATPRVRFRLETLGRRTRGGAHVEHSAHGCDAGRVEAQRLVERRRLLPSRKEDIRCGAACGTTGGRAVRRRGGATSGICGAHPEHAIHVCDAGRVEAQQLIERRRVLRRKEGIRCDAWYSTRGGRAVRRLRREQRVGAGTDWSDWVAGHAVERTLNMPYMLVTLDVSRFRSLLNADASCRVERRAYDAGQGAAREAGGRCCVASSVQGKVPTGEVGAQGKRRSAP
eukprot:scaffold62917_cov58-Phaeocystis_antarctica.AAC.2